METPEAWRQRVRREQQLIARLRLATTRLADADRERIWAIVAAKETGLSIRQIARATGLSPTRVHQLLQADEARAIPVWLSQLHDDGRSPHPAERETDLPARQHPIQTRLAAEVEVLRWCLEWLERLEHEEHVVVNLRPEGEEETEFVPFDRPRVLRVLARMAADLDELARRSLEHTEESATGREELRARHRQRLAEPEPQPRRLSQREERAALRPAKGLPPDERR
jgi:DNA-binding transcriptional MerR regulator